jgi:tetratricopeptide (TPR) repeat protein
VESLENNENLESPSIGEKTVTVIKETNHKGFLVQYDEKNHPLKTISLTDEICYVGRDTDSNLVLDHSRVSRRQFKVTKAGDKYYIQDLGSINGTFINGHQISPNTPTELNSGDFITVLHFKILFELRDPEFKQKFKHFQNLAPNFPQSDFLTNSKRPTFPLNHHNSESLIREAPSPQQEESESNTNSLNFFGLKIPLTTKNKIRLAIGALLLLILMYGLANNNTPPQIENTVQEKPINPFDKLSPEDQNYIKHTYSLAKSLFMKGEYNLASSEIMKLHEKIPKYEDSQDLEKYINLALEAQKQSELHTKIENEKKETEDKIRAIVEQCRKLIAKTTTAEELNKCLAPGLELNPEHPDILSLVLEVNKLTEERESDKKNKELQNIEIKKLKVLFMNAMKLSEIEPLKGIKALEIVMNSTLPDPGKLKDKARKQKEYILGDIKNKVAKAIEKSKVFLDAGNFKDAIMSLEIIYKLDPENTTIKAEVEKYTIELRKKMQLIYQEAIIEENIGNVESAIEKWRKIMDLDISNGEYFLKSQIKLKKYGLL